MGIDWGEIHRRLAEAEERAAQGWQPAHEKAKLILRARARELAAVPPPEEKEDTVPVVEFLLGPYRYGVDARRTREVLPRRGIAAIPCTPGYMAGLMNVRGRLLAVTDLALLLGVPVEERGEGSVIVLFSETMEAGITADAIVGVRSLPLAQVQRVAEETGGNGRYVKGLTRDRMALFDVEAFLADPGLVVNEQVG